VAAGFSGIGVDDSGWMDRAVKKKTKNSRKRAKKSRPGKSSPGQSFADKSFPDKSGKMRVRIEVVIRRIPRGKVSTYGAIARGAGMPGAARQVAAILRHGFGLPWQRVLGAGGEIKLRGDSAVEQRLRLEAEGVRFRGRRVDMKAHEFKFGRGGRS
jgi:methylated-DNA-protein-cysteine methyltransferase related protein